jgi:hypothetical protein
MHDSSRTPAQTGSETSVLDDAQWCVIAKVARRLRPWIDTARDKIRKGLHFHACGLFSFTKRKINMSTCCRNIMYVIARRRAIAGFKGKAQGEGEKDEITPLSFPFVVPISPGFLKVNYGLLVDGATPNSFAAGPIRCALGWKCDSWGPGGCLPRELKWRLRQATDLRF